jgi:putative membrane protein
MSVKLSVVVAAAAGLFACSRGEPARSSNAATPGPGMQPASGLVVPTERPDAPGQRPEDERLDDAQILGAARAINGLEIDHAKLAIGRARKAPVKDLASSLLAGHGRADKELLELEKNLGLVPADSGATTKLRVDATASGNDLADASPANFDRRFLTQQIEMHERALAALDEKLLPHASHPELKQALQRLRAQLSAHLETARALRDQLH